MDIREAVVAFGALSQETRLRGAVARLAEAGIVVSVFIDAEPTQIEAAGRIGAAVCEVRTGPYAHAFHAKGRDAESPAVVAELDKIRQAGERMALNAPIQGSAADIIKQAMINIATDTGVEHGDPNTRAEWAALAHKLGVKVIHIAERDTQVASYAKEPGEFVNTWSVDGFVSEGSQPAELGWGTHERHFPTDGARHESGCRAAIYLERPGAGTRVRTWTPLAVGLTRPNGMTFGPDGLLYVSHRAHGFGPVAGLGEVIRVDTRTSEYLSRAKG